MIPPPPPPPPPFPHLMMTMMMIVIWYHTWYPSTPTTTPNTPHLPFPPPSLLPFPLPSLPYLYSLPCPSYCDGVIQYCDVCMVLLMGGWWWWVGSGGDVMCVEAGCSGKWCHCCYLIPTMPLQEWCPILFILPVEISYIGEWVGIVLHMNCTPAVVLRWLLLNFCVLMRYIYLPAAHVNSTYLQVIPTFTTPAAWWCLVWIYWSYYPSDMPPARYHFVLTSLSTTLCPNLGLSSILLYGVLLCVGWRGGIVPVWISLPVWPRVDYTRILWGYLTYLPTGSAYAPMPHHHTTTIPPAYHHPTTMPPPPATCLLHTSPLPPPYAMEGIPFDSNWWFVVPMMMIYYWWVYYPWWVSRWWIPIPCLVHAVVTGHDTTHRYRWWSIEIYLRFTFYYYHWYVCSLPIPLPLTDVPAGVPARQCNYMYICYSRPLPTMPPFLPMMMPTILMCIPAHSLPTWWYMPITLFHSPCLIVFLEILWKYCWWPVLGSDDVICLPKVQLSIVLPLFFYSMEDDMMTGWGKPATTGEILNEEIYWWCVIVKEEGEEKWGREEEGKREIMQWYMSLFNVCNL